MGPVGWRAYEPQRGERKDPALAGFFRPCRGYLRAMRRSPTARAVGYDLTPLPGLRPAGLRCGVAVRSIGLPVVPLEESELTVRHHTLVAAEGPTPSAVAIPGS